MDLTFALFAVVSFLAVVLALEGFYNVWAGKHSAEARRLKTRLQALTGEVQAEVSLERNQTQRAGTTWDRLVEGAPGGARLADWVASSGLPTRAGDILAWSGGLGIGGLVVALVAGLPLTLALAAGLVLAALPWMRVGRVRMKRITTMENQFPEALDLMCRALRAGHAFPTAIRTVGSEMNDPIGKDFRILADEINYGVPMQDALGNLATRMPLDDVRFFMVAILIQRETGGNLAELLDKISAIVRSRLKLMGEVRTLSAEGRLSAMILTALPFGTAGLIYLVNPKFLDVLFTDPIGPKVIGAALLMMLLGIFWMRKIIQIRV